MRIRSGERGQVLPLIAICLTVIMGFSAMAIDLGYIEYRQRQQQSAADAAAIGGAQQLVYTGCNDPSAATTTGQADAATNGFPDETSTSGPVYVKIDNPPKTGPYANNNCAVQATITNNATQTFFLQLFGWGSGMPVTTEAVAASETNAGGPCVDLLGPNASPTFNGAKINAAGCSMQINGSPTFHGGTIDFGNIGYTGSSSVNGTTFTAASPAPMLPVADPCPEIAGCRALSANPPPTTNCGAPVVTNGSIGPGCYSSLPNSVSTLQPGMYVFTQAIKTNGGPLTGNGVTIYVAGPSGSIDLSGITANLTACTTSCGGASPYTAVANVLYFQPSSNTNSIKFAGPQSTYSGLIYAPDASVTYDGNAGTGYTFLVFGDWRLNGTGQNMDFAPQSPTNGGFVPLVVLVQ